MKKRTRPVRKVPKSGSLKFLHDKDIVVLAASEWEGPRRIRQYLTEELIKHGNRVLFVEANFTFAKFLRTRDFRKLLKYRQAPRELKPGLFVVTAPPFIPGGEFSATISSLNWGMANKVIRTAVKKLGMRDPLLWIYAYNASSMVGALGEQMSLYFCNDAFAQLHESEYLRTKVTSLERQLEAKVDAVVTVSEKLTEERKGFAQAIATIHHGVTVELFEKPGHAPELEHLPKPIVGYAGVIRHIIDLDLIEFLSVQRPEWSFVLVGPVTESSKEFYGKVRQLKSRSNVHFLGSKSALELPGYIAGFDVCLLPYRRGEVSSYYSSPLKFFEYLAAGKPVVSTVGPYTYAKEMVGNAVDYEDVLKSIQNVISHDSERSRRNRKALARENSWGHRLREIDSFLREVGSREN